MTGPTGTAVRVVLTTAPTVEVARDLGSAVVGERLAACANVLPGVTSIYRWEGEVKREGEALVILKTTAGAVERLRAASAEAKDLASRLEDHIGGFCVGLAKAPYHIERLCPQ